MSHFSVWPMYKRLNKVKYIENRRMKYQEMDMMLDRQMAKVKRARHM
jgi:hypothetical protein